MNNKVLTAERDPMGAAILDYWRNGISDTLLVRSSMFEDDEMPVAHLFRTARDMPSLEKKALSLVRGKVLDVGAGAGCHALALQEKGFDVTAIDISPLSCEAMRERGVRDVRCVNLFDAALTSRFDTLLLLMNGTGIAGKIGNVPTLLKRLDSLMAEGGQVLLDSSDLKYIYEEEDGSFSIDLAGAYYGEVDYQMAYKNIGGEPFDWLYVDFPLLKTIVESNGLRCELVQEGGHYDYLARLTRQ